MHKKDEIVNFVLGPTNTGKTFLATQKILSHSSAMIGLPLRLLAREVYEKIKEKTGALKVALITGEERIYPSQAKYLVCTVEAMPDDKIVDFIAVDEIQLAANPERGHIFTDRLLHYRGQIETMFMGSDTMTPIIKKFFPNSNITYLKRRSKLVYIGRKRLSNLPKRSAIISFTTNGVYELAEHIKSIHGGAALVLGALSPQTRNSQVKLYEDGVVNHIVATDAIGMGLNLDINHVALASKRKFDGSSNRYLKPQEIGQIAGRAGRNLNNGSFGETANCLPLDKDIISSVESHIFEEVPFLYWRSRNLDFTSVYSLLKSLARKSEHPQLIRVQNSEDELIFRQMSQILSLKKYLSSYDSIKLLWEISCIPDYHKNLDNTHVNFLIKIYLYLVENYKLPLKWTIYEIEKLQVTDGSIDMLTVRLAKTRIWNFISNKKDWLEEHSKVKEAALFTEKLLSTALHNSLTEAFVDKRTSLIIQEVKINKDSNIKLNNLNEVFFGTLKIGTLNGLFFKPLEKEINTKNQLFKKHVLKKLSNKLNQLALNISNQDFTKFKLHSNGYIYYEKFKIARLLPGKEVKNPEVLLYKSDLFFVENHKLVLKKIHLFIKNIALPAFQSFDKIYNSNLKGINKGIVFRLQENMGVFAKKELSNNLNTKNRALLRKLDVIIGHEYIYLNDLFYKKNAKIRWALSHIYYKQFIEDFPKKLLLNKNLSPVIAWNSIGYIIIKDLAIHLKLIESIAKYFTKVSKVKKQFEITSQTLSLFKINAKYLKVIMEEIGYKKIKNTNNMSYWHKPKKSKNTSYNNSSPFSILNKLQ